MRALVDPNSLVFDYSDPPIQLGIRVCEVAENIFPVANPLEWIDCPDNIVADQFYWNGNEFISVPDCPIKVDVTPTMPANAITTGSGGPNVVA